MRLTRRAAQREPDPLLVGVVTPTVLPAAPGLEELFRDAYERLHKPSLSYAERFLSRHEAEDAVADAEWKVWKRYEHVRPEQRSEAYYLTAVRSAVRDALRKSGRYVSLEDAESELDEESAAQAEADLLWPGGPSARDDLRAEVLDEALRAMPVKRREILLLIHEHEISWQEAAEELGLKLGTINTQMHRARKQIRAAFERAGFQIREVKRGRLPSRTGDTTDE